MMSMSLNINTKGVIIGAGTVYLSEAPDFTLVFFMGFMLLNL
jgi:hypothetical protein